MSDLRAIMAAMQQDVIRSANLRRLERAGFRFTAPKYKIGGIVTGKHTITLFDPKKESII